MIRDRETRQLALMLAPFLLGLAMLIALPAAITFGLALTEYDLIRSPSFIGLDNFRELWNDEMFRISLRNSLMFIAFAVPLRLLRRSRARAPPPPALSRRRRLPDRGLPAVGRPRRRVCAALALDLQPAVRAAQSRARLARRPDAALADRSASRAVGDHHHEPVPDRRGLPRRARDPPGPPGRAVRARRARAAQGRGSCSAASRSR